MTIDLVLVAGGLIALVVAAPSERIRRLPLSEPLLGLLAGVLLGLRRPLRLALPDAVHLGWFGPMGVSALFYLALEAERLGDVSTVLAAGSLVVVASVVVHGITAAPGRAAYRSVARRARESEGSPLREGHAGRRG